MVAGRVELDGENGTAIVELALLLPFLIVPLLLGTVGMATLVYDSIEVSDAANAGAMYAMTSSTMASSSNYGNIEAVSQADATDFGSKLNVTPTNYWACSAAEGGTQYATYAAAATACTGGSNHALGFIQVLTSASVTPPIHCPGLPTSFTLTGSSVMEVEE
jgi:Flp pilus assembly protein TadG